MSDDKQPELEPDAETETEPEPAPRKTPGARPIDAVLAQVEGLSLVANRALQAASTALIVALAALALGLVLMGRVRALNGGAGGK